MIDDSELKITIMPHKDDDDKSCAVFIEGFSDKTEAQYFTHILMRMDEIKFKSYNQGGVNDR